MTLNVISNLSSYRVDMVYEPLRDDPQHFVHQYVVSLYWTVTTLTTTGYG